MFCSQCGTDNRETSVFCRQCGTALRQDNNTEARSQDKYNEEGNAFQKAVLGQFRILSLIRTEPSALTFLCNFVGRSASCWIRVFPRYLLSDPDAIGLFHIEDQAASRLSHPNVQRVMESGGAGDFSYTVLESISGETLRDIIENQPLSSGEAAALVRAITFTLDYAHRSGVLHLNLRTENIAFTEDGSPMILGFGVPNGREYSNLIVRRSASALPEYISPEQILGKAIDYRADYYSLGVVLYELLTGRPPFSSAPAAELFFRHLNEEPENPSTLNPSIPPALADIALKLLSKDPTNRYLTTAALIKALDQVSRSHVEEEGLPGAKRLAENRHSGQAKSPEELPPRRVSPLPRIADYEFAALQPEGDAKAIPAAETVEETNHSAPLDALHPTDELPDSNGSTDSPAREESASPIAVHTSQPIVESAAIPVSMPLPDTVTSGKLRLVKPSNSTAFATLENYFDQEKSSPDAAATSASLRSAPLAPEKKKTHIVWLIALLLLIMSIVFPAIGWIQKKHNDLESARLRQEAIETNQRTRQLSSMALVTGGQFTRGSKDGTEIERPLNIVTVDSFYMDLYEVANVQYSRFITATNHPAPKNWPDGKVPAGQERIPVTDVSWYDASAYCEWRNQNTGLHFRLPTEAEWEYAARGHDTRRFPWGDDWDKAKANGSDTGRNQPAPIGSYPAGASPFGIQDMSGNVWEWTADNVAAYTGSKAKVDPGHENDKVIRGGSFADTQKFLTVSYRNWLEPNAVSDKVGFRCAVTK